MLAVLGFLAIGTEAQPPEPSELREDPGGAAATPLPQLPPLPPPEEEIVPEELEALTAEEQNLIDGSSKFYRSYPGGKLYEDRVDRNKATTEALERGRQKVGLKLRRALDDLERREATITNQTHQREELWKAFHHVHKGAASNRSQLREDYVATQDELRAEQQGYNEAQNWTKVVEEEAPPVDALQYDCATILLHFAHQNVTVRTPNLIPGCRQYEKAFQAIRKQEIEQYESARRTGREHAENKEVEAAAAARRARQADAGPAPAPQGYHARTLTTDARRTWHGQKAPMAGR